jgi:ribosome biogenesis GTPase
VTKLKGTVVAKYRRHCLVESSDGRRISCQIGRRSLRPIVGDIVEWRPDDDDSGVLTAIEARQSELARIDARGKREIVAANITQLIVIIAPDPAPDWFLVDRYFATAELGRLGAILVLNKVDLVTAQPPEIHDYATLGYPTYSTSARDVATLEPLATEMRDHRSVLIGQSGVGKSSLMNALIGDAVQSVGALSAKSGQGRHTTTTSVLYACPQGGELIDSPGVRDFAPYIDDPRTVMHGYRELARIAMGCRFPDCSHRVEPDCAVKAAVDAGDVCFRRYESYLRLYELTESLHASRR